MSVSSWNQCSVTFPSTIRLISMPENRTFAAGRWQPAEGPGVGSGEQNPLRVHPFIGHGVLHLEV